MERLIKDANRVKQANGEMANLSINSFADVTEAIHIIQNEMGITGTTAKEASTTIEGSLNSMKASWENLLVGLADKNANVGELINNLVESAVTFGQNVLPVVEQTLLGIGTLVEQLLPIILQRIPTLINEILPQLLESGINMVDALINGVQQNLPTIIQGGLEIVQTLLEAILSMMPRIVEMGMQLLIQFMNGIANMIPNLIPLIINAVTTILNTIVQHLPEIIQAGIQILVALIERNSSINTKFDSCNYRCSNDNRRNTIR